MYNREKSTVHLGLYGKTAAKTVKLLFEGLREPISYNDNNQLRIGRYFTGRITKVKVEATGEVVLEVVKDELFGSWAKYNNDRRKFSAYANNLDVAFVKSWLAKDLRLRAGHYDNDVPFQLHPKSATSQYSKAWEVRATADALDNVTADELDKRYGAGVGKKVWGEAADPVRTEINEVIVEETKRIHGEYDKKRQEAHLEMLRKISLLRDEYRKSTAEIGKQERAAVTKMKKEMLAA